MTSAIDRVRGIAGLISLVWRAARLPVPELRTLEERLANLPLDDAPVSAPVDIRWDEHAIPFVTAESLPDLAVGLGVVHAHLRLGQMEMLRRVAQGRISEMIGTFGLEFDIALRTIDICRTVPEIIAMLPDASRIWAESFLAGINHMIARAPAPPPECQMLDFSREPWTLQDLFSLARLASVDITWTPALKLLKLRETMGLASWATLWPELLRAGAPNPDGMTAALARGSNSAAVSGTRTASGAAIIASDPHVGLQLPSLWLACGMSAPGMKAAGLMIPGLPYVAIGRNEKIAWGATNLHAASSVFIDLSAETDPQITERSVDIAVRGVGVRHAKLRESCFGPVISDVKRFGLQQPTALGWVGHQPSDELTAMLTMNRADDFAAFQHALRGFAVQGYSFTYADATGRVGILRAGHVPARPGTPTDILEPASVLNDLTSLAEATGLFDPREGFVVSANEDPQTAVQAGFFFAPSDRALRQAALLNRTGIERADLEALQRDVTSSSARHLRDALARRATELGLTLPQAVLDWNGCYDEPSVGALAYEVLVAETADKVVGKAMLASARAVWTSRAFVASALLGAPDATLRHALSHGAKRAAQAIAKGKCWGDAHVLHLAHPLTRLPIWGRKFGVHIFGVPGSNDTLYKTGHGPARCGRRQGGHRVTYGSSARHLADFVDPDANFVIILGGQDGWIGSVNATDQIPLWREGRYLHLPLTSASVAARFGRLTQLTPPP
jgi:penicillin amidase